MMRKTIFFTCLISLIVLYSCKGKPSDSDIKKKILMEYTCPETSKVNSLNIISTKDAEAISGVPAYEYVVTGEIIWPKGCNEFGNMPAGHVEKFENKHVFLAKVDGNWQ
jgi:hypothetical protein